MSWKNIINNFQRISYIKKKSKCIYNYIKIFKDIKIGIPSKLTKNL